MADTDLGLQASLRASTLILGLLTLLIMGCGGRLETVTLEIGGERFRVEVARTPQEKARGLMDRKRLGSRRGMLFVYGEDRRLSFWMKNTSIPLSIAFLDKAGRIVQIEEMEPFDPTSVRSRISVRYALEVPRGTFRSLGVEEGDRIGLPESLR